MQRNVDVLMDRAPADAVAAARQAIAAVEPPVELRRLRLRQAAGRAFVDVVIGVASGGVVGQAHAVADRVEAAVERALPGSDVVVHVEPRVAEAAVRERIRAAAAGRCRACARSTISPCSSSSERVEASLHLKLPGDLPLEDAHAVAEQVERAIVEAVPEVTAVQTHIEPLTEAAAVEEVERDTAEIDRIVRDACGRAPREVRFLTTADGLVVFLTLGLDPASTLADAHALASGVEERVRACAFRDRRRDRPHRAVRAMRLCMFHPGDHPLERGWVGRVDADRVVQLAAQTLQSFFLGGGAAREHAEYPLDAVTFLAPVLHPPAVRIFETSADFAFANPAAILPPGATAVRPGRR